MFNLRKVSVARVVNLFRKKPQWLEEDQWETKNTPDVATLEAQALVHVFVYGQMMRKRPQHKKWMGDKNSAYLCYGFTYEPYEMWKKELGKESYPVALEGATPGFPSNRIKGELHTMLPHQVFTLDRMMENTVQFERRRVRIVIPHYRDMSFFGSAQDMPAFQAEDKYTHSLQTPTVSAFMYVGKPDYWEPMFNGIKVKNWDREGYETASRIGGSATLTSVRRFKHKKLGLFQFFSDKEVPK